MLLLTWPWWPPRKQSSWLQMTSSGIILPGMGEWHDVDKELVINWLVIHNVSSLPAVRVWRCLKRCWLAAALACVRLSSPRLWRCSRSSFRTLAEFVSRIKRLFNHTASISQSDVCSRALFSLQRLSSKSQSWSLQQSWWPPTPCPAAPTSPARWSRHRELCRLRRSPRSFSKRRASRGSTKDWEQHSWGTNVFIFLSLY